jgi:thiol:disulfide interchange protein
LNTSKTKRLVQANGVKTLKADKTGPAPEIDDLLVKLGNKAKAIPYVAVYPPDGSQPILLEGFITQQQVLDALQRAGPSLNGSRMATASRAR